MFREIGFKSPTGFSQITRAFTKERDFFCAFDLCSHFYFLFNYDLLNINSLLPLSFHRSSLFLKHHTLLPQRHISMLGTNPRSLSLFTLTQTKRGSIGPLNETQFHLRGHPPPPPLPSSSDQYSDSCRACVEFCGRERRPREGRAKDRTFIICSWADFFF